MNTEQPDIEIVGRLHYPGDVRGTQAWVTLSPKYGPVFPCSAEYDEANDRTTVEFAQVLGARP
jgi:hypothetical protein